MTDPEARPSGELGARGGRGGCWYHPPALAPHIEVVHLPGYPELARGTTPGPFCPLACGLGVGGVHSATSGGRVSEGYESLNAPRVTWPRAERQHFCTVLMCENTFSCLEWGASADHDVRCGSAVIMSINVTDWIGNQKPQGA
jgi:hypothetical protein